MKFTHSQLIEQYRQKLITFPEFLKATGYTSFLRPVVITLMLLAALATTSQADDYTITDIPTYTTGNPQLDEILDAIQDEDEDRALDQAEGEQE